MPSNPVRAVKLVYLDGEVITPAAASAALTVPVRATFFQLRPNGGDLFYTQDGAVATANSPGFVVDGGGTFGGPFADLFANMNVFMAAGDVHVMYYVEVEP